MRRMLSTLRDHPDAIMAATSIVSILVAVIGFSITIFQIIETRMALQSATMYEIQRDGREIVQKIFDKDDGISRYTSGDTSDLVTKQSETDLWTINNFYLSVFRQDKIMGLPADFKERFRSDFCTFVKNKKLATLWDNLKKTEKIGQSHEAMKGEWCG